LSAAEMTARFGDVIRRISHSCYPKAQSVFSHQQVMGGHTICFSAGSSQESHLHDTQNGIMASHTDIIELP